MPMCQVNRGCQTTEAFILISGMKTLLTAFFSPRNPSLSSPILQDLLQLQQPRCYNPHLCQIFSIIVLYLGNVEVTPLPPPAEEAARWLCHTAGAQAKAGNTGVKLSVLTKPPGHRPDTEAPRIRSPSPLRGSQQPRPEAHTMLRMVMSPLILSPQVRICLTTLNAGVGFWFCFFFFFLLNIHSLWETIR